MSRKQIAKRLMPPVVFDGLRWLLRSDQRSSPLDRYLRDGRIPWSPGYDEYKRALIMRTLEDEDLLARFRRGEPLPPGYGVAIDERCIEYPWLIAHTPGGAGRYLDAGSALNNDFLLDYPALCGKELWIMTLAPEGECFWWKGVSYVFCDLREIPVVDAYFDTIACISTLEHVGFDNTLYTHDVAHRERRPETFASAMRELRRVLKPGGTLLLSVPFGAHQQFQTFQQFDRALLCRAIDAFGPARDVATTFYRYSSAGWNLASAEACADCRYAEWTLRPREQWPKPIPVEPDRTAAARAVACVRMVK